MKKIHLLLGLFMALAIASCKKDDKEPTKSSLNSMTSFVINFEGLTENDVKTEASGNNITISVPYKTPLTGLKPIIEVSDKATVSPASGTAVDFEDGKAVPFTITAEDGTTKVYNVTINVRGEVGSGSRIQTYTYVRDYSGVFKVSDEKTEYTYNNESGFVSKYSFTDKGNTTNYEFVYNNKNQITELKGDKNGEKTIYSYNESNQIISAKEYHDVTNDKGEVAQTLKHTFNYEYDTNGLMIKKTRIEHENNSKETINNYKYENDNVIEQTVGTDTFTATKYDDKMNPFKNIFPKAYAIINADIHKTNKNNPLMLNTIASEIKYEYNTDGYPVSATYNNKEVPITVTKQFTYYAN